MTPSAPASALRHYDPRHLGDGDACGPARLRDNDCRDVSCGSVRPAPSARTDEGRALRRRGRGVDHVRRRRGARDAHSAVVPDASRLRPGGLGLAGRRLPLHRVEQRWLQLRQLGRRTAGRSARHHGLPSRLSGCIAPARPARVIALTSHPHHWRWTRTISARGAQRSERGVRPRNRCRRQRGSECPSAPRSMPVSTHIRFASCPRTARSSLSLAETNRLQPRARTLALSRSSTTMPASCLMRSPSRHKTASASALAISTSTRRVRGCSSRSRRRTGSRCTGGVTTGSIRLRCSVRARCLTEAVSDQGRPPARSACIRVGSSSTSATAARRRGTQRDRCLQNQRGDRRALAHPECRHTRLHAADLCARPLRPPARRRQPEFSVRQRGRVYEAGARESRGVPHREQWNTHLRAALRRRDRPQAAVVDGNRRGSLTASDREARQPRKES